jgi:hypothetical protein
MGKFVIYPPGRQGADLDVAIQEKSNEPTGAVSGVALRVYCRDVRPLAGSASPQFFSPTKSREQSGF